jgi:hypothetical protein
MESDKTAHAELYSELAGSLLQDLQEKANQVVSQKAELGPIEAHAALGEVYYAQGKMIFTGILVWERVEICCFSQPPVMSTTDVWGVTTAIGGISWGTYKFSVPFSQLQSLGDLTVQITIIAALVTASFWKSGTPVGTYIGGGLGIGTAFLGGSCKFVNGSC